MNKASDLQFKLKHLIGIAVLKDHTNTFSECLRIHKTVRLSSSSFELHCVNCLFARWCWVMVHAHRFPGALESGDVEHWQPSVKIRWGRTGSFGLKGSFASSLKAYHMRAEFWHHHFVSHLAVTCRGTRSVTQRPESASVDLNSNMPVSAALKTSTWATARKCILSTHPKIGT